MSDDDFKRGMDVRRRILGPKFSDEEYAATTDFNRPLQELVTRYAFGEVWDRPGLPLKTRIMITMAMLVALNRPNQVKMQVRMGLKHGLTHEEIREVLLQAAPYCGLPAAVEATRLAMEVFEEPEGL